MNDKQLEDALRSLEIPQPDAGRREEALRLARAELADAAGDAPIGDRRPWRVVRWAALPVAAILAFATFMPSLFTSSHDPATRHSEFAYVGLEDSMRILQEVRMLFPDHLQAVIVGLDGIDIRLYEKATRVSDQPILVELTAPGAEPQQLISYSGQTINTTFDNRPLRLELLVTGSNGVLITGEDFVWTEHDAVGVNNLQIRAQRLKAQL